MEDKEKALIFIPYQDTDNFYSEGIMTREYAILYSFFSEGYKKVINVKKPRTFLDSKKYTVCESNYPEGTIERAVKNELEASVTIQYKPIISIKQILQKRIWWVDGYRRTILYIDKLLDFDRFEYTVYSNNPFAFEILSDLKRKGCNVYFDIMDNFAIHPSLSKTEKKEALSKYIQIFKIADVLSANSEQTKNYMKSHTKKNIFLVKNGVFPKNEIKDIPQVPQIKEIQEKKQSYKKSVGYIGKLGLRLDAKLIKKVSRACPDILFIFVGEYLKGQANKELLNLFKMDNNLIHIKATPSAYVYSILDEFDILSIPHSVGENENGGDPLKLYQYLTRKKAIITTSILGVEEFKKYVKITNSHEEWINYIRNTPLQNDYCNISDFTWESRLDPIMKAIRKSMIKQGNTQRKIFPKN